MSIIWVNVNSKGFILSLKRYYLNVYFRELDLHGNLKNRAVAEGVAQVIAPALQVGSPEFKCQ
jgi:hypothetical protein